MPVIGSVHSGGSPESGYVATAFRKGLGETGYVEGQNVTVEHHWLEGQYDRLPALMADLVRRWRRPGQAWSCRQPRAARRQRNRH
jgi:putative tryptophan/tyrosine transport system substrate-binding protein